MALAPTAAGSGHPDRTEESLLTVRDLSIASPQRTLVDGVGFTLEPGERLGLIGESGSGKSMTSLALMGLLPEGVRASGSARLRGVAPDLLTGSDRQMQAVRGKDIAMVFQEPLSALNPLMKAGAQVAEIMQIHRTVSNAAQARERAVEMLAKVQLPDPRRAAQAYPHQLSGGQRQRVMLAMALANDPALLLADEPTTALDVTVQRQVLDLVLEAVRERGTGLLFITHDLAVVANMCDRVLVMHEGRVVEQGAIDQVFTRPQHWYTKGLLAASDLDATDERGRLFTVSSAAAYVPPATEQKRGAGHPTPASHRSTPSHDARETSAPGESVIAVRDLVRTYRRGRSSLFGKPSEVQGLRGISFDVARGQRFGVVGESGSGKSTLLRILAGLDQPTSGSAVVAGNEVAGAREHQLSGLRRDLQIVFQDPMGSLDPRMNVEQIVAEPLRRPGTGVDRRVERSAVREMLAAVGLPEDAAERYPHQFSGGQRQRISIARALICQPQVLVADEPVSALDVSVRAQVLNLLADLVDRYRLTLVFVSHDLGVVRHICDNVIVMNDGRIVESGPTEQVYDHPEHDYTRTLVGSSMSLRSELAGRAAATA